jgi:hypothetical protein
MRNNEENSREDYDRDERDAAIREDKLDNEHRDRDDILYRRPAADKYLSQRGK